MKRRPNPARSRYPTWAPTTTPAAAASAQVCRNVDGSPAWKPQATLAEVTMPSIAASSPRVQRPNDSPRSEFRSTHPPALQDQRIVAQSTDQGTSDVG